MYRVCHPIHGRTTRNEVTSRRTSAARASRHVPSLFVPPPLLQPPAHPSTSPSTSAHPHEQEGAGTSSMWRWRCVHSKWATGGPSFSFALHVALAPWCAEWKRPRPAVLSLSWAVASTVFNLGSCSFAGWACLLPVHMHGVHIYACCMRNFSQPCCCSAVCSMLLQTPSWALERALRLDR